MEPLDAEAVSKLLIEIGQRLELTGESPFKARAYYNAADSLLALTAPLAEIIAAGKLREIPGVGEAISEKIGKLHRTGTHPTLDYLRQQIDAGTLELLRLPGLGPKKVIFLVEQMQIKNLAELETACKAGRLKEAKGMGAALEAKILKAIEFARKDAGRWLLHHATEHLNKACENLAASHPQLSRIQPAGDVRRGCEVVENPCVVAQSPMEGCGDVPVNADLRIFICDEKHYGAALLFATGSSEHVAQLVEIAKKKKLVLTEKGLRQGEKELPCPDEASIYTALELPYIDQALREGRGEIGLAKKNALPVLVCDDDIRGVLHSHTDASDGSETLDAMAEATRERGYQYYGVADHSQAAAYARGLKEDRVRIQHVLADKLNAEYAKKKISFRIFKGIESDILEHGELDYPDELLSRFDFIVASVHSRFTLEKTAQTARLVNAVSNPHTTILGHMTGRLLLKREGYRVEIDEVLKACAAHGVVVEINANPHRLDLDWRFHQRALELGCMLSINPDAHAIREIDLMKWGVLQARKGGLESKDVLNCLDLPAIAAFFAARKKK